MPGLSGLPSVSGLSGIMGGTPPAGGGDWWNPDGSITCEWAAYQPKGAADFAASLLDLTGNGNNASDLGPPKTPDWDAVNGWKLNGIAHYLATSFVPQNDQSQTCIFQFTNGSALGARYAWGSYTAAGSTITIDPGGGVVYYNGASVTVAPQLTAGNLAIAGNQGYRNGVADGAAIGGWAGASTIALWIGCLNVAGVPASYWSGYIQAFAIYDCALTAPQVALVAAAMAAL